MIVVTRIAMSGILAAASMMPSQVNAGCFGGSCGRGGGYRAPIVVRPIIVAPHHHHHDEGPGGGGGPGFGPGGSGGGGGQGQGAQGGGQQGFGGGQQGGGQNGQVQNGQNQNGQVQNGQNQNQNGQNQNGQNQNQNGQVTQNQNGQNQNGQNNTAAVQVPSGSQITLSGDFAAQGQVYLNINNVKIPLTVDEWTTTGITLTLPAVQLTQAQSVTIDVVTQGKTDSIAVTLNPKARVVVNTQPQQPAGQGGANGNLAATDVAGAQ